MSIYMSSGYVLKCKYIIIKYDHKYCLGAFGLGQASPFKTQLKYLWRPQGGSHKRFGKSQLWSKSLPKKKKKKNCSFKYRCLFTYSIIFYLCSWICSCSSASEWSKSCLCVRGCVCCIYFCIFDSVGTEQTNRIALNALSTDWLLHCLCPLARTSLDARWLPTDRFQ